MMRKLNYIYIYYIRARTSSYGTRSNLKKSAFYTHTIKYFLLTYVLFILF